MDGVVGLDSGDEVQGSIDLSTYKQKVTHFHSR